MWKNSRPDYFWFILSSFLLSLGAGLYALYRPLYWMPWNRFLSGAPLWLHQQLPDALWPAAFAAFLLFLKGRTSLKISLLWPLLLSWILEGLQASGHWPGTPDLLDAMAATAGIVFLYGLYYYRNEVSKTTC